ncbi:MAG: hypothetical protein ACKKMS_00045 [Candidatus Nealsonbacteria bacterium]
MPKTKTIKAWAIVNKRSGKIETAMGFDPMIFKRKKKRNNVEDKGQKNKARNFISQSVEGE